MTLTTHERPQSAPDAFGLDSDTSRLIRLFFQPVLVVWALWSTGAWAAWRARRKADAPA